MSCGECDQNSQNSESTKTNGKTSKKWLNILSANRVINQWITEVDKQILKYLFDILVIHSSEPFGVKIEFHFDENNFFKDRIISKEYRFVMNCFPIGSKWTPIEWKPTNRLFDELPIDSFFNFFDNITFIPLFVENDWTVFRALIQQIFVESALFENYYE